jgi:hypothetical protein
MFDELESLRADEDLRRLLAHYAERGEVARDAWQDRVMECGGRTGGELVRLHGQLLAQEWIEMNVGVVDRPYPGAVPECYRVTSAGLRALKRARQRPEDEDELLPRAA